MKARSDEPDFGATGQFELTGVYFSDKKADAAFATTLGMESIKSLVLVGVGPAQLQVLTQLARNRRSDVDVTLVHGYGFPRFRGGPMQYADRVGLPAILADIQAFALEDPLFWQPAPLLVQLIEEGRNFGSLNQP